MRDKSSHHKKYLKLDTWFIKVAASCVVLLVLVQILLLSDGVRKYLSKVDKMEGESIVSEKTVIENLPILRKSHQMYIRMITPSLHSQVYVTINGKTVGDFSTGKVKLVVYEGDYIEIDARELEQAARYVVDVSGTDIISPFDGLVLQTKHSILSVGKIKFKQR